jgi:hypothetical protein
MGVDADEAARAALDDLEWHSREIIP